MVPSVHISAHPLVQHRLAVLRNVGTEPPLFRRMVRELAQLLFVEASADLQLEPTMVTTPLAPCSGMRLSQSIGLVPILRAGMGMVDSILELVPDAQVWHLGLYRDHKTLQPVTYYKKLTGDAQLDVSFILDPMLATGGSALAAVSFLKEWGLRQIKIMALIAAPEGVRAVQAAYQDIPIYLGTWTATSMRIVTSCQAWEMRVIGFLQPIREN